MKKTMPLGQIKGLLGTVLVLLAVAVVALNSVFMVPEQNKAIVSTFGVPSKIVGAGLRFRIPFVQSVYRVDITTRVMRIGYEVGSVSSHMEELELRPTESTMITADNNIIVCDLSAEWRVSDPVKFVFESQQREEILRDLILATTRDIISSYNVDEVLTDKKHEAQTKIKDNVIAELQEYDLGIDLQNIFIQDVEPPTHEVINAFKDVENARQKKDTIINEAKKYVNERTPQVRGEVDKILKDAQANHDSRINEAKGEYEKFNSIYTEYIKNPQVTRNRLYLDAMQAVLSRSKIVVDGNGETVKLFDLGEKGGNQ